MRPAYLVLPTLALACTAARADEIPARFRGVWVNSAAKAQACRASDWTGAGNNGNDALIQVTAKSLMEYESGCDIRKATTPASGPATLTLSCSGEGETSVSRQAWEVVNVRGNDVLIMSEVGKPDIRAFVRCR